MKADNFRFLLYSFIATVGQCKVILDKDLASVTFTALTWTTATRITIIQREGLCQSLVLVVFLQLFRNMITGINEGSKLFSH